jgi:predicted dehydrogenase
LQEVTEVRLAVIGAGVIGLTHLEAIAHTPGFQISGIVEPGATGVEIAARRRLRLYADLDDAIGDRPDGAIVATPNETHVAIATRLVEAGIPVLVEKPIAGSVAEARRLVDLSAKTGIPVLTGHHRRFNPIIEAARTLAGSPEFGHLVQGSVLCALNKPASYFDVAWRRAPEAGGPLLINLIHEIDLLRHLFGEIDAVTAIASNRERGLEVEDTAGAVLAFAAGGLVTISISDCAAGPWAWDLTAGENPGRFPAHRAQSHFFSGSAGAFSLPDLTAWSYPAEPSWTEQMQPRRIDVVPGDAYQRQILHFGDVIAGRAAPRCSALDGMRNLAVVDAIKRFAKARNQVFLDPLPANATPLRNPETETAS